MVFISLLPNKSKVNYRSHLDNFFVSLKKIIYISNRNLKKYYYEKVNFYFQRYRNSFFFNC